MQMIIQTDLPPLARQLTRLAGRLQDLTSVMSSIGGLVEGSTRRRIAEEKTTPEGDPWKPLSARTIAAKTSRSGKTRGGILVDRGNLLKSITHEAAADSVIIGSVMLYARWLQEGTQRMEARPFLGLSDKDYRDIDELLADWLNGLIEEA